MIHLHRIRCSVVAAATVLLLTGPVLARQDSEGFLYGRVVTESGTEYTGFLRWGEQEAFWDDLFQSAKTELPYLERAEALADEPPRREKRIEVFGWKVRIDEGGWNASRIFCTRFGDIALIEPRGDGEARITMKSGSVYDVSGYADDVSSDIHVLDGALGAIDLHWDRIRTIEPLPVPGGADPGAERLHGRVETVEGEFEGFIQWDKSECLTADELDGDTRDGRVAIAMGEIATIERHGRRSCDVTLRDGRELNLRGTNDVNSDNRGIVVEDARLGRVTIGWKAFDRLTFTPAGDSGPGYRDYPPLGPVQATVVDRDGGRHRGRLVFDLDESEGWEMLNGSRDDVEFDIPLVRLRTLVRESGDRCRVVLDSGAELTLEEGHDVGENNAGLLVFPGPGDDDALYLPWDEVDRIEFHAGG